MILSHPSSIYEKGNYIGYSYDGRMEDIYHYEWRYIYEGVEFIGGDFGMVELSTGLHAVSSLDIKGKITASKVLAKFKEKLLQSGKPLPVIVGNAINANLDLKLWLINLII